MAFRADVISRLTGDSTIQSYCGSGSSARVFSVVRPAYKAGVTLTTGACIVVRRLSANPGHDLSNGDGWEDGRFEIRCISSQLTTADSMAEAVRQRLQGESGTWGTSTIHSSIFDDEADDYQFLQNGEEVGEYHVVLIYRIIRELSVPA